MAHFQCDQMAKIIYAIFGLLEQWKFAKNHLKFDKNHLKFIKVGTNFWQILNKPFQNSTRLSEFCQSGEISPNLVTLLILWNKH